jgi:hypothetical protein
MAVQHVTIHRLWIVAMPRLQGLAMLACATHRRMETWSTPEDFWLVRERNVVAQLNGAHVHSGADSFLADRHDKRRTSLMVFLLSASRPESNSRRSCQESLERGKSLTAVATK